MDGSDRRTVPAGIPDSRRPWYVDLLWAAYLVWALPHFALTYWPTISHWLRGHHPG